MNYYTVELELPYALIGVHAKDEEDAAFRAWHMLGLAGFKSLGRIEVKPAQQAKAQRVDS